MASISDGFADRRYVSEAMRAPLLSREYETDLARRWRDDGDEAAMHEIVESHGRLVISMAARFRHSGMTMDDLIQEGNSGLLEAARRFDPERGVRFSTYAGWWVRAAIQAHILRNTSMVRAATTPRQRRLFFGLRRLRSQVESGLGARLSTDDREAIAGLLGVSPGEVELMESHIGGADRSLNVRMGEDGDGLEHIDLLADEGPDPEAIAGAADGAEARRREIDRALAALDPRERLIVESRFLSPERPTLAELGKDLGVSKERVRQLESRAIGRMRKALESTGDDHLRDLLGG